MDDLQKSELVISKILSLVISWGIQSSDLKFEELELDQSYKTFFIPCVRWLCDEGVLRALKIHTLAGGGGIITNPVLTSYDMNLMGETIQLGNEAEKMATAVGKVSSGERSYSQTGDFLGGLLGGFTKSLGS